MRKCLNCEANVRDTDRYCRNCGCVIQSNKNYIITNVIIVFIVLCIISVIALFVASYLL